MESTAIQFWLGLGIFLIVSETIVPGLVSMFVGLGALTVAALLYFQHINTVPWQLITWFASSTVYIFTLRLLFMKYYPMDSAKEEIDEDVLTIGQTVEAAEDIPAGGEGRISFNATTWQAKSLGSEDIKQGEKVKILKRENITWLVEKANKES